LPLSLHLASSSRVTTVALVAHPSAVEPCPGRATLGCRSPRWAASGTVDLTLAQASHQCTRIPRTSPRQQRTTRRRISRRPTRRSSLPRTPTPTTSSTTRPRHPSTAM
jgi:hypothetical protein